MSRPGEQNSIRVGQIKTALVSSNSLPVGAAEGMRLPAKAAESEVGVPTNPDPIELKPLNMLPSEPENWCLYLPEYVLVISLCGSPCVPRHM